MVARQITWSPLAHFAGANGTNVCRSLKTQNLAVQTGKVKVNQ